jgi:hypothetical protein
MINFSHNRVTECLQYRTPLFSKGAPKPHGEAMLGSMLTRANLSHNCIEQVDNIDHHPFLEELILSHNRIEHTQSLNSLSRLQILDLSHNQLTDVASLHGLKLKELYLDNNQIVDLTPISSLQELNILSAARNHICSLEALQRLSQLQAVDLKHNSVQELRQVAWLRELQWLHALTLAGNPCASKDFYRCVQHPASCEAACLTLGKFNHGTRVHSRYGVVGRLLQLKLLDGIAVTAKDKVKASNLLGSEGCDLQARIANYEQIVGERPSEHYERPFVDDEL